MDRSLALFGLELPVPANGAIEQPAEPGLDFRAWAVTVHASLKVDVEFLVIVDGKFTFESHIVFQGVEINGRIQAQRGEQRQASYAVFRLLDRVVQSPADAALTLDMNTINKQRDDLSEALFGADGSIFATFEENTEGPLRGAKLPLEIKSGPGGFAVDLRNRSVIYQPRFLRAVTRARAVVPDRGGNRRSRDFFKRTHFSLGASEAFQSESEFSSSDFAFTPEDSGVSLALNCDQPDRSKSISKQNSLMAPIDLNDYQLTVRLTRPKSSIRFAGASLTPPGAGGMKLRTWGISTARNRPALWSVRNPIHLHVRIQSSHRSAAFLVAPVHPEESAISLNVISDGNLHGYVAKTQFDCRGTRQQLICSLASNHDKFDPEVEGIEPQACRDSTLPWIALDRESQPPRLFHPKAGDSYLQAGATGNLVDVWRFTGDQLGFPLMPEQLMRHSSTEARQLFNSLNDRAELQQHELQSAEHETRMNESPAQKEPLTVKELFKF